MTEMMRRQPAVTDQWHWQLKGSCRQVSPETFFHPEGERGSRRRDRADQAKGICQECPVIAQCRAHALTVREPYGVWGGLSEDERIRLYSPPPAPPRAIAV